MNHDFFTPDAIFSEEDQRRLFGGKSFDNDLSERLLAYSKQLQLQDVHEKLDTIFNINPDSYILKFVQDYAESITNILRNARDFLDYVNTLDYKDCFYVSKNILLSLLLLDNDKEKKKDIDEKFVFLLKCFCSDVSQTEIAENIEKLDSKELRLLEFFLAIDGGNHKTSRFNKSNINRFVRYISNYKLDDAQRNKVFEALLDENKDYSIDEIFKVEEPKVVLEIISDVDQRIEENKEEIIKRYGEKFYSDNKSLFTKYVLSRNIDRINEIIDSDEFKKYPEVASATVLAKSSISHIRKILDIPYLQDDKYKKLISPSLFVANPKKIINNIDLCIVSGLSEFSDNKTLIIKHRPEELLSKINFLNYYDEPLFNNKKLHPLFSYDSEKEKEITKKISGCELDRNALTRYFNNDTFDILAEPIKIYRKK